MTELTGNTASSAGSGVCELTNQSRFSIGGGGALKRQELKQSVSVVIFADLCQGN